MERHFGMDWLRIGAFGLLILYHVGMVFVPWGFQVKTAHPLVWGEIPMFLTSPWRLTLLFVVSGFASRALATKSASVGAFLHNRSTRLLMPLLFGVAFIIPPQAWVELSTQHGYQGGFLYFWTNDYFRFGKLDGIVLPTWNHLWFVLYLWVYTAPLAVALALLANQGPAAQLLFDRTFAGWRALILPICYFLLIEVILFHRSEDTHDLFGDGVAHLRYGPAFLFGFGLAGSSSVLGAFARQWIPAATIALGCFVTIAALLMCWPDFTFPNSPAVLWTYRVARHVETWAAIAALIGVAERFWNRDHQWRSTLAEATFPFYIIHQTVIVVVEAWLLPLQIGALTEFAILVSATAVSCWGFYVIGRRIDWLRPFIGLRRHQIKAVSETREPCHAISAVNDQRAHNWSLLSVRQSRPGP